MKRIYLTFLLLLLPIVCSAAVVRPLTQDVATIQSVVSDLFGSLKTGRTLNLTNSREIDNWLSKYNGSYTRASSQYVTDFEGIVREVPVDQIGIQGGRLVQNYLLDSDDLTEWLYEESREVIPNEASDGGWFKVSFGGIGSATHSVFSLPNGITSDSFNSIPTSAIRPTLTESGNRFSCTGIFKDLVIKVSFEAKSGTADKVELYLQENGAGSDYLRLRIREYGDYNADGSEYIFVRNPQVEIVTGQANQNPSEYVVNDGTEGSGYQWFDYENGNTVASNIVTAGMGTSLDPDGFLQEPQATNLIAVGKYRLDSAWDIETATVTKDQTGIDGTPNSAVTITDDSVTENEALQESLSVPDDTETYVASIYVKKQAGLCGLIFALSNGTGLKESWFSFNPLTGAYSQGEADGESGLIDCGDWWRCWFAISNNGTGNTNAYLQTYPSNWSADGSTTGSIICDWAQIEIGSRPTSPVIGGATRAVSDFHFDNQNWQIPAAVDYLSETGGVVTLLPNIRATMESIIFSINADPIVTWEDLTP